MKTRLTDLAVSRLRPPKRGKYSWTPDALLPSFGLRVYVTGRRVWGITRRWDGAKNPSFRRIGDYGDSPPALSLADARTKARAVLSDPESVAPGAEPDQDERPDQTFAVLAEQFLAHGRTKRGRELRAATVKGYRRALLTYATAMHRKPVGEVRRADAADLIRTTATKRGATTAMRTRAAGSRFYSWLIANGKVEHNPFTGTEGYDVPKRSRVLSDGEIAAIWSATEDPRDFGLIVRLCLWTGCRRSEAGGMRWSELTDGVWLIPGSRTKNHRPLALPLPRQALAALEDWHRFVGRDFVFGRGPTGFQAWSACKARLDARIARANAELRLGRPLAEDEKPAEADALKPWDLHDLRRTVETRMAGLGIPKERVNKVLNHAVGPVTAAYDQWSYLPEKAGALQAWADELERIIGRPEPKVVALPSGRAVKPHRGEAKVVNLR
jgi:integrase